MSIKAKTFIIMGTEPYRVYNKMNFDIGLYPVITEEFCRDRAMTYVLRALLDAGVKIVQLRQKKGSMKEMYGLALEFRKITEKNKALLIINDHVDLALAVKADGVHLGQDDLPCFAARRIAPDLIIGVSTHSQEEINNAENDGATYVNIGPVFETGTKEVGIKPLGTEYLKNAKTSIPFTVMGGIKKDNIEQVLAAGARNIAMVTALTMAEDITKTAGKFIKIINKYKGKLKK
jgi:thiamine-phosphate pyrophosphorylase